MDSHIIGDQITKFRKALGLTQEELGRAVGVSTQAVSRWECGGAPDVALLPTIADRLGVTIDCLFGREGGSRQSLSDFLREQVPAIPESQRYEELLQAVWQGIIATLGSGFEHYNEVPSCYPLEKYPDVMCSSRFETNSGYCTGILSQEFSFLALCPEPEAGYAAFLPDKDQLRKFFAMVSRPGCLEIMEYFMGQPSSSGFYTPEVLARAAGISPEDAAALLEEMALTGMAASTQVELMDGPKKVYCIRDFAAGYYLTLCYTARWLMQSVAVHMIGVGIREKPWLKPQKGEGA